MSSITTRPPILVVEPDLALRTSITYILRKEGHFVLALGDLQLACEVARENPLSLIVLDPVHLDNDELALCRLVRANPLTQYLPIVLLLTREREITQVEQLGLRITDYLLKPVLWEELRACIQALLRGRKQEGPPRRAKPMARFSQNTAPAEGEVITVGTLSIDLARRRVSRKDQVLDLTRPLLFELLVYLVRHRGTVLTRAQLLAQVWGYETPDELMGDTHTVSVHIHWLRQLLEEDPEHPHLIQTVRGTGYRFLEESQEDPVRYDAAPIFEKRKTHAQSLDHPA